MDGAFNAVTRQGGWGFVVRDAQGSVRGSGIGRIQWVASVLQTEAIACSEALHTTVGWSMGSVQVENDSTILARTLQSTDYDRSPEGIQFRDMRVFP
jgi:ribonuclease HI